MTFEDVLKLCDRSPFKLGPPKETIRDVYDDYRPWFDRYRAGDLTLEKNLLGITMNGLTEEEAFFIIAYSSSCSRWLNGSLWTGEKLTDCKNAFAVSLDASLTKMKPFNGTVFRMDSYPGNDKVVRKWFRKNTGKKFSTPCFLS